MKKILTVSLFAMMAVSAANADIASTKYVTDRTGTTANLTTTAKELTGAVNELKTKLDKVAGDSTTSVADQITAAKNELTTEIGKVDDKADANAAAIAGLDGTYATDKALSDGLALKQDKSAMVDDTNFSGDKGTVYPTLDLTETLISEANNNMAGEVQQVVTDLNNYKTTNNAAVEKAQADATAAGTAASKAQGEVDALESVVAQQKTDLQTAISDGDAATLASARSYADAEDKKIEDTIGTVEQGKTVVEMIAEAKDAASGDAGEVAGDLADYIASNNTAVAAAKTQADKGVADAATAKTAADKAQGEVDALEGVVAQQKTDLQKAISDGDTATLNAAKADATTKADTAKSEAIAAAKLAGDAAYAAKSYETIVDANEAFREAIASGTTGTDGTYALTATVSNNTVSGYKWELIGR